MKALLFALTMWLMSGAQAASLKPILITDGMESSQFPCDGEFHITTPVAVNAHVVRAYLFATMAPNNVNGMDVILWSSAYGGWGSLADVHLLHKVPAGPNQGESDRSFQPDSVYVTTVSVVGICWGGGRMDLYSVIYTRALP